MSAENCPTTEKNWPLVHLYGAQHKVDLVNAGLKLMDGT